MEQLIPPLIMVVIAIVVFLLVKSNLQKYREYLLPLSRQLDNGVVAGSFNVVLTGRREGYEVRVEPHMGGKNSPPSIVVIVFKESPLTFAITTEGKFDRMLKSMGIFKEIQVGDPDFDEKYLLRVGDEGMGRMLLSNSEVRDAIARVFDLGYESLRTYRNQIRAHKRTGTFQMQSDLAPDKVLAVIESMVTIARHMP